MKFSGSFQNAKLILGGKWFRLIADFGLRILGLSVSFRNPQSAFRN
jgi:hypothetical protein